MTYSRGLVFPVVSLRTGLVGPIGIPATVIRVLRHIVIVTTGVPPVVVDVSVTHHPSSGKHRGLPRCREGGERSPDTQC